MLNSILYGTHFVPIRFNKLLKTMISTIVVYLQ